MFVFNRQLDIKSIYRSIFVCVGVPKTVLVIVCGYISGEVVSTKDSKSHDDTVIQSIELLERADDLLCFLIEVKIPELINKSSNARARWEEVAS